jgi:thiosulfate/3-mercaptopyruvate sulfurtransferase
MALSEDPLVEAAWLLERLPQGGIVPLDATWFFPFEERDAHAEHQARRIPGAVFFDIDAVAESPQGLPHMLPSPAAFGAAVGALGVGQDDLVVVYESGPPRSAARAWWSFRAMGHDAVRVLDGGLLAWIAAGGPLESGPATRPPRPFRALSRPHLLADIATIRSMVARGEGQILDARPAARFRGEAPEPRPGLRPGRIPGALSVPAGTLYDEAGRMLGPQALRRVLEAAGADLAAPAVASCGSGITACIIALALRRAGAPDAAVYDGSFAEWGRPGADPVLTGA